jgi:hypothetical protein
VLLRPAGLAFEPGRLMYRAYGGNPAVGTCSACGRRACAAHLRAVLGVPVCAPCRPVAWIAAVAAVGLCAATGVGVAWLLWR